MDFVAGSVSVYACLLLKPPATLKEREPGCRLGRGGEGAYTAALMFAKVLLAILGLGGVCVVVS